MTTKKPARPSVARSKGAQVKKAAPQAGTVRVAAIQMASGPNVPANLSEAEQLIELAVEAGARLVVLPEFFCLMALKDAEVVKAREADGHGPIQTFLARMAKKHKIWLIGGSIPLEAAWSSSTAHSAASGCRSATTCAFPSCTAPCPTSTSSWCRRHSLPPPGARISRP
jgi:nitrilase